MLMMEYKSDYENMNEGFIKMNVNDDKSKTEYIGKFFKIFFKFSSCL